MNQAGFKLRYSCDDHLFVLTMLYEVSFEWNSDFWIAAVDLRKAFDLVHQSAIWQALVKQGVPTRYVFTLQKLYREQFGSVLTDVSSRAFSI